MIFRLVAYATAAEVLNASVGLRGRRHSADGTAARRHSADAAGGTAALGRRHGGTAADWFGGTLRVDP